MSTEENKALMRRWWESLNEGNANEIIEEIYAANYVLHDPTVREPVEGLQGVREFVSNILSAFSEGRYTIEDLVAEDDQVVQRIRAVATHTGDFQGIPATGKPIDVWVMVISRVAGGKVVEEWQLFDALGMLRQMGLVQ